MFVFKRAQFLLERGYCGKVKTVVDDTGEDGMAFTKFLYRPLYLFYLIKY